MTLVFVDLVLDSGELVRVECPGRFEDELLESIENCMKRRDWWAVNQFDRCSATFLGVHLERVNMARVVGTL